MDRISRLRFTVALAWEAIDVSHKPDWSKESAKSSSPRPGRCSGVDKMVWVEKAVGVLVGGNQMMVVVGVPVAETGVGVGIGAGNRPLQAVRKTSRRMPRQ